MRIHCRASNEPSEINGEVQVMMSLGKEAHVETLDHLCERGRYRDYAGNGLSHVDVIGDVGKQEHKDRVDIGDLADVEYRHAQGANEKYQSNEEHELADEDQRKPEDVAGEGALRTEASAPRGRATCAAETPRRLASMTTRFLNSTLQRRRDALGFAAMTQMST